MTNVVSFKNRYRMTEIVHHTCLFIWKDVSECFAFLSTPVSVTTKFVRLSPVRQ